MDIPNVGKIKPIKSNGRSRVTGVNDLIKLTVNAWRNRPDRSNNRVITVSDIFEWAKRNGEVRSKVPKCP